MSTSTLFTVHTEQVHKLTAEGDEIYKKMSKLVSKCEDNPPPRPYSFYNLKNSISLIPAVAFVIMSVFALLNAGLIARGLQLMLGTLLIFALGPLLFKAMTWSDKRKWQARQAQLFEDTQIFLQDHPRWEELGQIPWAQATIDKFHGVLTRTGLYDM